MNGFVTRFIATFLLFISITLLGEAAFAADDLHCADSHSASSLLNSSDVQSFLGDTPSNVPPVQHPCHVGHCPILLVFKFSVRFERPLPTSLARLLALQTEYLSPAARGILRPPSLDLALDLA